MLLLHQRVVHLVDVVAGQDQHMFGLFGANGVDVLEHRIRRPLVPGLGHPLHRRQDFDELAEFAGNDGSPAFADVPVEGKSLVLGEDVNVSQVGVDAVGQGDVDDAVLAGKGNCRFGAVASQRKKPFPSAACEQNT